MPEHSGHEEGPLLLHNMDNVSKRSMRGNNTDRSRRTSNYSRRLRPIW
jgi:hypothetical protein